MGMTGAPGPIVLPGPLKTDDIEFNKSSAVAEIGDRLVIIDMGRTGGSCMVPI